MTDTISWPGKSGKTYKYYIYKMDAALKDKGGNYCFAKETSRGRWKPIYFGETRDLSERFDNHHKMDCIKKEGATGLHAHINEDEDDRLAEEADLVDKWNPPCNG